MLSLTVGQGRRNPKGSQVDLDGSPVHAVAGFYSSLPAGVESWVSPHCFTNAYRDGGLWLSAAGVIIDIDYDAPSDVFPGDDEVSAIIAVIGQVPGNFYHLTPHGVRVACVFPEQCSDRDLVQRAAQGACELATAAIDGLPYKVDRGATCDLARFFYTPRCRAKGVQRDAPVVSLSGRSAAYAPADLAAHAPALVVAASEPSGGGTVSVIRSPSFDAAARQWVLDHTPTYPKPGTGECPVCKHKECFGQLPDDSSRWYCFSANHVAGIGVQTDRGHHGDALDLEAYARGCKPVDVLRADGYLAAAERAVRSQQRQVGNAEPAPEQRPAAAFRPWRSRSYLTAVDLISRNERDILDGKALEYNEMSGDVTVGRQLIHGADVSRIRANIEARFVGGQDKNNNEIGLQLSMGDIEHAVEQVAHANAYHPVREYLEGLTWDGVERLEHVAADILGAVGTQIDNVIVRKFFVSAVARALEPGCKVDTVFVLVGPQGALKSTFFEVLAGAWFVDTPIDISSDSVRAYMTMRKAWILEFAELESLLRARDQNSVKAYLSSKSDNYVPKFSRYSVDVKRSGVIVGTWNPDDQGGFLNDPTGERRYWPLTTGAEIDLATLREQRDQLWAEAVALHRTWVERGRDVRECPWWLNGEEKLLLVPVHDEHSTRDVWAVPVLDWLAKCDALEEITVQEILSSALSVPRANWTDKDSKRVARILRASKQWKPNPTKSKGKPRSWVRTGVSDRGENHE